MKLFLKPSIFLITLLRAPHIPPPSATEPFPSLWSVSGDIKADPSTINIGIIQLMQDRILGICYCILKFNTGQ